METVFLGSRSAEEIGDVEEFLARRRALDQDRKDEVWEGVYHVAPDPHPDHGIVQIELSLILVPLAKKRGLVASAGSNIGPAYRNFRVPDGSFFDARPPGLYVTNCVLVIEVLSPDDETWDKFDFYAAQGVQEIIVAHPQERWVRCFDLQNGAEEVPRSRVLDVSMAEVVAAIDWP